MFYVIQELFKLTFQFINSIYNIEFELLPDFNVKIGTLALVFIFILLSLYLVLKGAGVIEKE